MATTDIVFTGLSHMANQYVEAVIGGLDCGSFLVSPTGSITVPLSSNSMLTGEYLQSIDVGPYDRTTYGDATTQVTVQVNGGGIATVYVPVTIGFLFLAYGQVLRPNSEAATKSPAGGATGKLRRVWSYSALLASSQGVSFGTNLGTAQPAPLKFNDQTSLQSNYLFNGVVYGTVQDADDFDGMLCWSIPGPYPFIMMSLTAYIETHERS